MKARAIVSWIGWVYQSLPSVVGKGAAMMCMVAAFSVAWSQTGSFPYTVLYKFPPLQPDQFNRVAGNLLLDPNGTGIYGALEYGGNLNQCENEGCGEIFRLSHGSLTDIFDFAQYSTLGVFPNSGLVRDRAGNLYGETMSTVYEIDTKGNATVLASFDQDNEAIYPEGNPSGGLVQDKAGNLFGATAGYGGLSRTEGEIFKVDLKGNKTVLYRFGDGPAFGAESGLILDAAGTIYGTTGAGGSSAGSETSPMGYGVLYKLSSDGTFTVLHNFTGTADGGSPGGITFDTKGNLFGFTSVGGVTKSNASGAGTIYEYDSNGNFTILYTFTGGADGAVPVGAPLLYDSSIFGAATEGGYVSNRCPPGCGVVFRLSPSGKETVLHTFIGTDGSYPTTGLVKDNNYNLYGAAAFLYRVSMIPER